VNTLLADRPAGADPAQPPASAAPEQAPARDAAPRRACQACGATLAPGQEWCLQCGAGVPGSVSEPPSWRPIAAIAAATVIVLGGAAAAAYAALSRPTHRTPPHIALATVPPPTSTPATSTPLPTTPLPATPTPSTPATPLPPVTTKPPSIPALAPTPSRTGGSTGTTPTTTSTTTSTSTTSSETTPTPILLDTNAASDYNPYAYPASSFGDPSLAIDGETSTAWTAAVQTASAPRMAEGLLLDLHTARHLGSLEVDSTPVGSTVEVFGANGTQAPATITDPAWKKLSAVHVLKKSPGTIKLHNTATAFRFVVLWLTKAPAGASRIDVGEVALFAPTGR
jgi:hypothetical protein